MSAANGWTILRGPVAWATVFSACLLTAVYVRAAKPAADSKPSESDDASANSSDLEDASASDKASNEKSSAEKKPAGKVPTYGIPQVEFINGQIRKGWADSGFTPSAPATDGEWCRRLFLDVLGRTPSVEELQKFLGDTSPDKKRVLVNRLLGEDYVEEYARNWTTLWTNILIGRNGGNEPKERRMTDRPSLQQALRRAFQRNMPYDRFVYELVSATGVNTATGAGNDEKYNGFTNFLTGKLEENGAQATAKTAQIFLGLQVQCTQCHNHPFNEWKQNQFWEMNAFFRQTRALRRFEGGRDIASIELANEDFAGEDGKTENAALFYELRNGKVGAAWPAFVDGSTLASNSGWVTDCDRRTELAKMMIKSDYLGKAIANRMWAHFLGYGFTKPIDDMGPHNAPSHPDLLEGLGKQVTQHSFDLKELMRWITLSEAYSLSSRYAAGAEPVKVTAASSKAKATGKHKVDDPTLGEKPAFSHFYLRQMRAEELFESLLVATEAQKTRGSYEEQEKLKNEWLSQFVIAFGTDDNDETTTFNGSIPQALMMWNGDLIKKATSTEKGGFLYQVAMDGKKNNAAKMNYLFLAAFGRTPTKDEASRANELWAVHKGDAVAALQDMWWAVLNSAEFILNH